MAKAKHFFFLAFDALEEFGYILHAPNSLQHAENSLIGSPMQRPIQRPYGPCHCRVDIHTTGSQVPCSLQERTRLASKLSLKMTALLRVFDLTLDRDVRLQGKTCTADRRDEKKVINTHGMTWRGNSSAVCLKDLKYLGQQQQSQTLTAVEQFISCSAWRVNMMSIALARRGLGR